MLNLTKPQKETIYMKITRVLLAALFLVTPLMFFTDLTENPFQVQNTVLYVLLALIYATMAVKFLRSKTIDFTKTFFDLAFFVYVIVCAVTWLSAVSSEPQALRQTMFYNMLNYGTLLLVVALGAYVVSKNVVFSGVIESKTNYILLFIVWGSLWLLLPYLHTMLSADNLFARMFDWYAVLLWAAGIWLGMRVLKKVTQENIIVLVFISVFLACVYGVLQALGLEFLWPFEMSQFASKAFSTFGNPNFLSSAVVMLLPAIAVYFLRAESKKDMLVYGFLTLVYLLYLSFGLARSCWLGAACGFIMMWMFGSLRSLVWSRRLRAFLLILLAFGVLYGSAYFGGSKSPVAARAEELSQVTPSNFTLDVDKDHIFQSLHQRLFMWDVSKEIFLSRPVMGAGLGNFQMAFAQNQYKTLLKHPNLRELKARTNAPHNEVFFQLAQGGIVGVGLFLFMFMVLFLEVKDFASHKKEGDKKQLLQAVFCGILGMLVDNMLNISLHAVVPAFIFWWFVGAEVSGVGKEDRTVAITVNPVTKTVGLAVLAFCGAVIVWQGLVLCSYFRGYEGLKLQASGQVKEAQANYARALALYPANTEAGLRLGNTYLQENDYKNALTAYEKTLSAAAYYDEVYLNAALAALGAGEEEKAVRYLTEHLKLSPFNLRAYVMLGSLIRQDVIYANDDNLKLLDRGVHLFPYAAELWTTLGDIYVKRDETEFAKNLYKRGLTADTLDRTLLQNLKRLYKKTQEALPPIAAQAQRIQDLHVKAANYWSQSVSGRRKLRTDIEAYIKDFPNDTNGPILLALYFNQAGNALKSKELLEGVLKEHPEDLSANLALSSLLYRAEQTQDAVYYLKSALFYYPENPTATKRLAALGKK